MRRFCHGLFAGFVRRGNDQRALQVERHRDLAAQISKAAQRLNGNPRALLVVGLEEVEIPSGVAGGTSPKGGASGSCA
jgi:hypothetical protein